MRTQPLKWKDRPTCGENKSSAYGDDEYSWAGTHPWLYSYNVQVDGSMAAYAYM